MGLFEFTFGAWSYHNPFCEEIDGSSIWMASSSMYTLTGKALTTGLVVTGPLTRAIFEAVLASCFI